MLRMRTSQTDDSMFRWVRTEMKRELVMSQSSYAKIAGLQSEIGRVVITRVAGSELEYKRTLNMYRRDAAFAVNNIRREQIKMRMKLARYVRKLKQTRIEHARMIKDQQRHDHERALLEELHLRLKFEAAAKTPEPPETIIPLDDHEEGNDVVQEKEDEHVDSSFDLNSGAVYLQTGIDRQQADEIWHSKEKHEKDCDASKKQTNGKSRKQSIAYAPILPMINEDDKEIEEIVEEIDKQSALPEIHDRFDLKVWDDNMSVSSYGGRIKRKNDVSFSDIIKLKYSGTKNLFDVVHKLARKHGIPDVEEKVPDPRDNVVHRGATNDSLRLQAAVLYPMKYGYDPNADMDGAERRISVSKSPAIASVHEEESNSDNGKDFSDPVTDQKASRMRRISVDSRRSLFLSGKHSSRSVDESEHRSVSVSGSSRSGSPRKLRSRDVSMPELVDRVSRIKLEQADRLSASERITSELISSYNLLAPPVHKPSSSRSSRSLPAVHRDQEDKNVSWTQAMGLLRAIHSLENLDTI